MYFWVSCFPRRGLAEQGSLKISILVQNTRKELDSARRVAGEGTCAATTRWWWWTRVFNSCLTNESTVFFTVRGRLSCMFVLFGDDYVMLGSTAVCIPHCRCHGSACYNPCIRQYCVPLAVGRTAGEIGLGWCNGGSWAGDDTWRLYCICTPSRKTFWRVESVMFIAEEKELSFFKLTQPRFASYACVRVCQYVCVRACVLRYALSWG